MQVKSLQLGCNEGFCGFAFVCFYLSASSTDSVLQNLQLVLPYANVNKFPPCVSEEVPFFCFFTASWPEQADANRTDATSCLPAGTWAVGGK